MAALLPTAGLGGMYLDAVVDSIVTTKKLTAFVQSILNELVGDYQASIFALEVYSTRVSPCYLSLLAMCTDVNLPIVWTSKHV